MANKSNAPAKKSSADANARLANGSGQPASSPAARNGQRIYAEDRSQAMDLVQDGQLAIRRERLAFMLGVAIRHLIDTPRRLPIVPEMERNVEVARGAEEEVEVVGGRTEEEVVPDPQRRRKRKMLDLPEDGNVKPRKRMRHQKVRFERRVKVHLASRELALCSRRPFMFMGSPICSTSLRLKRPAPRQQPRRYSREEFAELAAQHADLESIPLLQPKSRPSGCSDTCEQSCSADCSCLANGLKCSKSYGCQCKHDTCNNVKNGPIDLLEFIRRKLEEVEIANEKTRDWPQKDDSTLGSEGSFEDEGMEVDEEVADADAVMDEEMSDADEVMDESMLEADTAMIEPESPPLSPPDCDFYPPSPPLPIDASQQSDVTMRLSDGDDSSPDNTDDSDSSDSDSSNSDFMPTTDLTPDQYSQLMLQLLPASIDQQELDCCEDGENLGGVGVFVALLKIATIENQKNNGTKVAVAHPDLFKETVEMVEKEEAGTQAVQDVPINVIQDSIVYGNGWTDLVIPMLVNGNHWSVAVVRRSLVSTTVYDSLLHPLCPEKSIAVLKKLLASIQKMSASDKTLSRFKLQYCRPSWRDVQRDGSSCGLFAICHTRRALQRKTRSAAKRTSDAPIDVQAERKDIKEELVRLVAHFEWEAIAGRPWTHAPGTGQLRVEPAKTPVTIRYSGRGF